MGLKKKLSILLCTTLMFSLIFGAVSPALAKSTREAIVDSIVGEVKVTKAGGSKSYRAFEGMTLNQGDHIETGSSSKVVLRIVDHEDEITIDEKSSIYISELSENTKGKKSKVKMWAGSLWGKVKTLTGTDDEFEVETPTAVMGVRGTTLLLGVDPVTGQSKFYIASGVGNVNKKGENGPGTGAIIYPSQQITLDRDTQGADYANNTNIADLDNLIANTSSAIIEAIIASKSAIDLENAEFLAKLQSGGTANQEEIDRINQNLDNLIGNIVNNAIAQGKVDEKAIKDFIDKINEQLDKKLDLANVKPLELSTEEKAKQERIKLLEAERKKKQEAEKLKQDELKKQNEALLKKLQEQLEKQKQEKQKAEEAAKKKAAEEFAKKLTDVAAKLAFEAKQKALADEKAKQAAAKAAADKAAAEKAAKAAAPKAPATPAGPTDSTGSTPPTIPVIDGKVILEMEQDAPGSPALLKVYLEDFGEKNIYGVQLHFTYDSNVSYANETEDEEQFQFEGALFYDSEIVTRIDQSDYNCTEGCESTELMVVALKYSGSTDLTANVRTPLVKLPFANYYMEGQSDITLVKVIVVDALGNKYTIDPSTTWIVKIDPTQMPD